MREQDQALQDLDTRLSLRPRRLEFVIRSCDVHQWQRAAFLRELGPDLTEVLFCNGDRVVEMIHASRGLARI